MKPHPHKHLIIAWANGAKIQRWAHIDSCWKDLSAHPVWDENQIYRLKPEPKDDIVKFINVRLQYKDTGICRWDSCDEQYANLKLVFDGDTGEIKLAEVLK